VIIVSYKLIGEEHINRHVPKVAIMDENNTIVEMLGTEPEATVY